jgi:hypothetical protein
MTKPVDNDNASAVEELHAITAYLARRQGGFAMAHPKSFVHWRKELGRLVPTNKAETDLRDQYLKMIDEEEARRKAAPRP